jgi:predicted DNA-binding transcriptional regulator AlpA
MKHVTTLGAGTDLAPSSLPQTASQYRAVRSSAACAMIGVSESTLSNWTNPRSPYFNPKFPQPSRIGARVKIFQEAELIEFVRSCQVKDGGAT